MGCSVEVDSRRYVYLFKRVPDKYRLYQNYPNPFNSVTVIEFDLPERSHVSLVVYDILGRRVKVLLDGEVEAGTHRVTFDSSDLPSGVYLYQLQTEKFKAIKKMIILK